MSEGETIKEALIYWDYHPRRPTDIYVTDMVLCPRRAFFNAKFNANPIVMEARAFIGKCVHAVLPQILKSRYPNAVFEVSCQYPLDEGYVLLGRADMVDADCVYEFKFTSAYSGAKELYFAQANAYANMLGCGKFKVVIIDRNKLDVVVLEGEKDEEAFRKVVDVANEIVKCLQYKDEEIVELPQKSPWSWACEHCTYKMICRAMEGTK